MENVKKEVLAFPQSEHIGDMVITHGGMTLRDYFVAKAITGICADGLTGGLENDRIAAHAYLLADAMLAERVK